jgi:hypothetical protein
LENSPRALELLSSKAFNAVVKIVRFLLTVALGGIIGPLFLPRSKPYAYVLITNNASNTAQTVRIESENGSIYLLENLAIGSSKPVRVFTAGESSYKLTVVFSDGKTLRDERYIESGYKLVERLTDDKIETSLDF